MNEDAHYEREMTRWEALYDRICDLLEQHGTEDSFGVLGDYWVHDDYWGYPQVKIYVHNLSLFHPSIVASLQRILVEFSGWEIVFSVSVREKRQSIPEMGLLIHANDVVDDLRREYLPPEFRNFDYNNVNRSET